MRIQCQIQHVEMASVTAMGVGLLAIEFDFTIRTRLIGTPNVPIKPLSQFTGAPKHTEMVPRTAWQLTETPDQQVSTLNYFVQLVI